MPNRQVIEPQTFCETQYVCLSKECISSGDSDSADGCRGESCISTLLVEAEKWDDALPSVKQRLQSISGDMDFIFRLNHLGAHISETKVALTQVTKVMVTQVTEVMVTELAKVTVTQVTEMMVTHKGELTQF